jgi:CRISPR-associated protein Cst2
MRAKFMEVVFLTKSEKSNVNASGTEGNITSLKKTTEIDDTQRIFISGASVKYSLKQYLADIGWELSPLKSKTQAAQVTTECKPDKYIDDDLFGYMDTEKNVKRVAPVKTSGMISLFPYASDLNRGVRFDPETQKHSLYDIEISTSVFRSNWAIELDRVGVTTQKSEGKVFSLPKEEREKRVKAILEGIFHFWSRVKQSTYLTNLSPEVIALVLRDDKAITIGDKLRIDTDYNLDISTLKEALEYHSERINEVYIGYFGSFLKNATRVQELKNEKVRVLPMAELKKMMLNNEYRIFA